jgi:hypothetical protein
LDPSDGHLVADLKTENFFVSFLSKNSETSFVEIFYETKKNEIQISQAVVHYLNEELKSRTESFKFQKKISVSSLKDIFILNDKLIFIDKLSQEIIKFTFKTLEHIHVKVSLPPNAKFIKKSESLILMKSISNSKLFNEENDSLTDVSVSFIPV